MLTIASFVCANDGLMRGNESIMRAIGLIPICSVALTTAERPTPHPRGPGAVTCFLQHRRIIELDNPLRDLGSVSCNSAEFDTKAVVFDARSAELRPDD